jgi:hypothetical protein
VKNKQKNDLKKSIFKPYKGHMGCELAGRRFETCFSKERRKYFSVWGFESSPVLTKK